MDESELLDPSDVPWSSYISGLRSFTEDHAQMLQQCASEENTPVGAVQHLVAAALRRSAALVEGFLTLLDNDNRFAAVPLIRLQLDSAMRVTACRLVSDPVGFVEHILQGGEPRKYKGSVKCDLSDKALHTELTKRHESTSDLYSETNAYIHLSNHHLYGFLDWDQLCAKNVVYTDHGKLPPWPESDKKGAMLNMVWATTVLTDECSDLLDSL